MQDRHQGVEHLGGNVLVDAVVLREGHPPALEAWAQLLEAVELDGAVLRVALRKNTLEELLDLFLVTLSVVVPQVPPFFVLV